MGKLNFILANDNLTFLEGIKFYPEYILFPEVVDYTSDGKVLLNQKDKNTIADSM